MLSLLLTPFLFTLSVPPQVVEWSFQAKGLEDGRVVVELTATTQEGWHIYATKLESDLGPIPTSIRFEPSTAFVQEGSLHEPDPVEVFDPNFEMQVRYHSGTTVFVQHFKPTSVGGSILKGEVEYMVCNDVTCLPPKIVTFSVDVPAITAKP